MLRVVKNQHSGAARAPKQHSRRATMSYHSRPRAPQTGQLVLVDARCAVFANAGSAVSSLAPGVRHDTSKLFAANTAVACCNLSSTTFHVQTMALSMFCNKADKEAAQITF